MEKDFWFGKKVFITGHTGFKGGWLALWLQHLGAHVSGYALKPDKSGSMYISANVDQGMDSFYGDILDAEHLEGVLSDCQPDIVFHLAAQPLVLRGYESPRETYLTNIIGTVNILESVRRIESVKGVVNITTDKCYKNFGSGQAFSEQDPMGGYDPYSSSKASAELVSDAYRKSYFAKLNIGLATARAGNVIGGGDWADFRLVPDVVKAFHRGEKVRIRNPNAIRPWQYVLEPLSGYLTLGKLLYQGDNVANSAWNFGPSGETLFTVKEMVQAISGIWGEKSGWILEKNIIGREDPVLQLDTRKAKRKIDWCTRLAIIETISYTTDWYKKFFAGENLRDFSIEQIQSYTSLLEGDRNNA